MTNSTASLFPWHEKINQQLSNYISFDRLPHALLFVGPEGLGKKQFALDFAKKLLCGKSNAPCNDCHACHLYHAASHPDLIVITPEGNSQTIKVDQIRAAIQSMNETTLQSTRVVIIHPANKININAANALLKTLEEPASNNIIILISDQNLKIPATILSRCAKIFFKKPDRATALSWLELELKERSMNLELLLNLANGYPLKAKMLAENEIFAIRENLYKGLETLTKKNPNPLQYALEYQGYDLQLVIQLVLLFLQDMMRIKFANETHQLINIDYKDRIRQIAEIFSNQKLLNYLDFIKKIYGYALLNINLNRQLLLEDLFIRWAQYATH